MVSNTKSIFDDFASNWINESYNSGIKTVARLRLEIISSLIKTSSINSLVDIGCGDGRFLNSLNEIEYRLGIDYSDEMLKLAKFRSKNVNYIQEDLNLSNLKENISTKLNIEKKFQVATMLGVIHYLEQPSRTLSLVNYLLEKNGLFILSFRNKLFNINSNSNYYNSTLTRSNLNKLKLEAAIYPAINEKLNYEDFSEKKVSDSSFININKYIQEYKLYEGTTDNFWNPEQHANWKQFTPLEAINLLSKVGFSTLYIYPIYASKEVNEMHKSTSFILVGKKIENV